MFTPSSRAAKGASGETIIVDAPATFSLNNSPL